MSWAREAPEEVAELWALCPRGDWLLGIAVRLGAETTVVVRAAAAAARTAFDFLPDDETRAQEALRVADAFSEGSANEVEVARARASLEALSAEAPDPAVQAAAQAALAALAAIEDPAVAPMAATQAAQAAVFDAGECAMMAALRFAQEKAAGAVRAHVSPEWAARAWGRKIDN